MTRQENAQLETIFETMRELTGVVGELKGEVSGLRNDKIAQNDKIDALSDKLDALDAKHDVQALLIAHAQGGLAMGKLLAGAGAVLIASAWAVFKFVKGG